MRVWHLEASEKPVSNVMTRNFADQRFLSGAVFRGEDWPMDHVLRVALVDPDQLFPDVCFVDSIALCVSERGKRSLVDQAQALGLSVGADFRPALCKRSPMWVLVMRCVLPFQFVDLSESDLVETAQDGVYAGVRKLAIYGSHVPHSLLFSVERVSFSEVFLRGEAARPGQWLVRGLASALKFEHVSLL